jgi:spore coat protein H
LLGVLACGAIAFSFVIWVGHRSDEGTFSPQQEPQAQRRFTQTVSPDPQELPLQAEASLAESKLPLYELKIAPEDLRSIETSPFGNTTYSASFIADGKTYQDVKVRARGSWSRSWAKKSLKILFDHQNPLGGHNSLNLNSGWRDPAFVREVLSYKVFAACGVPASRAQMVRLQVNGRFHGLYVEVEQPDKDFLSRHNLKGATLYKATSRSDDADERDLGDEPSYQQAYTKQTRKTEDFSDLSRFCHELGATTDTSAFFNQHVDLDEYVNYLAATVLIQNWDGLNKNHYLAYDRQGAGKWRVIPWDLDRTFGDHWHMRFDEARLPVLLGTRASPGVTGWNRLEERFLRQPTLRLRFLDRLSELLETEFTTAKLFPVLDKLEEEIAPAAELDRLRWPGPAGDFHSGIAGVKSFIEKRRAFLQAEIPKLRAIAIGTPTLN